MNTDWPVCKLSDLADVRVSNVDKKFSKSEIPVRLCNYMDVYENDYVTESIDFMTASASRSEIDRFGLRAGDVVVTKDSETPDDIGVPAVVSEPVDGLVCGYHLALIRPRKDIDSIYLAKQLSTTPIVRYFGLNASGSTRFGLPVNVIENARIPVAPRTVQTRIAKILLAVDRAIEQTKALIIKQKRIKTGLMQDLLTRGIDEHGNLRTEQTHKFKDSPLGRIPLEWKTEIGTDCFTLRAGVEIEGVRSSQEGNSLYLKVDDLNLPENLNGVLVSQSTFDCPTTLTARLLQTGTIIFPKRGAAIHLNRVALLRKRATLDPNLMGLCTKSGISPDFFRLVLLHRNLGTICDDSGIPQINNKHLYPLTFAIPDIDEQNRIVNRVHNSEDLLRKNHMQLLKLRSLKSALMKDLLTKKPEMGITSCEEIADSGSASV